MTALKQMGEHDLKELGIPMVYFFCSVLSQLLYIYFFLNENKNQPIIFCFSNFQNFNEP